MKFPKNKAAVFNLVISSLGFCGAISLILSFLFNEAHSPTNGVIYGLGIGVAIVCGFAVFTILAKQE